MPLYRDEGVVLRTQKLGEADRIITLLTRRHGRVRAVANGVRKTSSRFGSRLEPFMQVDLQLAEGRSLDRVIQAELLSPHGASLSGDYARWTHGAVMLEAAERLTVEEKEPALQQYRLLAGAVRTLAAGERDLAAVVDAYLLGAVALAGFAPTLDDCASCGEPGPHAWFSVPGGGAVCHRCRPPGTPAPGDAVLAHVAALLSRDWDTVASAAPGTASAATGLVRAYAQWHLDRDLRTLRHAHRG
jgi:DNA repair protein RecO (recombination protein O)